MGSRDSPSRKEVPASAAAKPGHSTLTIQTPGGVSRNSARPAASVVEVPMGAAGCSAPGPSTSSWSSSRSGNRRCRVATIPTAGCTAPLVTMTSRVAPVPSSRSPRSRIPLQGIRRSRIRAESSPIDDAVRVKGLSTRSPSTRKYPRPAVRMTTGATPVKDTATSPDTGCVAAPRTRRPVTSPVPPGDGALAFPSVGVDGAGGAGTAAGSGVVEPGPGAGAEADP